MYSAALEEYIIKFIFIFMTGWLSMYIQKQKIHSFIMYIVAICSTLLCDVTISVLALTYLFCCVVFII